MPIEEPFKQGANFEYLREVILRRTTDGPVPIIEMMADGSIMGEVTGLDHTIDHMTELTDLGNPDRKGPRKSPGDGLKFLDLNLVGPQYVVVVIQMPGRMNRIAVENQGEKKQKTGGRNYA